MPMATNTHSEYETITAFELKNSCTKSPPYYVYTFISYLVVHKITISMLSVCLSARGGVVAVRFKIGKYVIISAKLGKTFMPLL